MGTLPKHYLESSHITADVKAFDNEYPTVSVTALHKPLHFICGSDAPPTPGSAEILADPPLTSSYPGRLKFSYMQRCGSTWPGIHMCRVS